VAESMALVHAQASGIEGGVVRFTAQVVDDPQGTSTMFTLNAEEAITLGEGLARFGKQVIEDRKREQDETIKRYERGSS
jgi:carbon monoxide dehydrogenase subunit G